MSPHVTRRGFLLALGLTPIAAKAVTAAPPAPPPVFQPSQAQREFFGRDTGKTTRMVDAAIQRCLADPGRQKLLVAATSQHLVTVLLPIVSRAAHALPPRSVTCCVSTRTLTFQNGSRLKLHAAAPHADWYLLQARLRPTRPSMVRS